MTDFNSRDDFNDVRKGAYVKVDGDELDNANDLDEGGYTPNFDGHIPDVDVAHITPQHAQEARRGLENLKGLDISPEVRFAASKQLYEVLDNYAYQKRSRATEAAKVSSQESLIESVAQGDILGAISKYNPNEHDYTDERMGGANGYDRQMDKLQGYLPEVKQAVQNLTGPDWRAIEKLYEIEGPESGDNPLAIVAAARQRAEFALSDGSDVAVTLEDFSIGIKVDRENFAGDITKVLPNDYTGSSPSTGSVLVKSGTLTKSHYATAIHYLNSIPHSLNLGPGEKLVYQTGDAEADKKNENDLIRAYEFIDTLADRYIPEATKDSRVYESRHAAVVEALTDRMINGRTLKDSTGYYHNEKKKLAAPADLNVSGLVDNRAWGKGYSEYVYSSEFSQEEWNAANLANEVAAQAGEELPYSPAYLVAAQPSALASLIKKGDDGMEEYRDLEKAYKRHAKVLGRNSLTLDDENRGNKSHYSSKKEDPEQIARNELYNTAAILDKELDTQYLTVGDREATELAGGVFSFGGTAPVGHYAGGGFNMQGNAVEIPRLPSLMSLDGEVLQYGAIDFPKNLKADQPDRDVMQWFPNAPVVDITTAAEKVAIRQANEERRAEGFAPEIARGTSTTTTEVQFRGTISDLMGPEPATILQHTANVGTLTQGDGSNVGGMYGGGDKISDRTKFVEEGLIIPPLVGPVAPDQNGVIWHGQREGIISGSIAGALFDEKSGGVGAVAADLADKKLGNTGQFKSNHWIREGSKYEHVVGTAFEVDNPKYSVNNRAFFHKGTGDWEGFGVSPDAILSDPETGKMVGLAEYKFLASDQTQKQAVEKYKYQMQMQMAVTGAPLVEFMTMNAKTNRTEQTTIYADPEIQAEILARAIKARDLAESLDAVGVDDLRKTLTMKGRAKAQAEEDAKPATVMKTKEKAQAAKATVMDLSKASTNLLSAAISEANGPVSGDGSGATEISKKEFGERVQREENINKLAENAAAIAADKAIVDSVEAKQAVADRSMGLKEVAAKNELDKAVQDRGKMEGAAKAEMDKAVQDRGKMEGAAKAEMDQAVQDRGKMEGAAKAEMDLAVQDRGKMEGAAKAEMDRAVQDRGKMEGAAKTEMDRAVQDRGKMEGRAKAEMDKRDRDMGLAEVAAKAEDVDRTDKALKKMAKSAEEASANLKKFGSSLLQVAGAVADIALEGNDTEMTTQRIASETGMDSKRTEGMRTLFAGAGVKYEDTAGIMKQLGNLSEEAGSRDIGSMLVNLNDRIGKYPSLDGMAPFEHDDLHLKSGEQIAEMVVGRANQLDSSAAKRDWLTSLNLIKLAPAVDSNNPKRITANDVANVEGDIDPTERFSINSGIESAADWIRQGKESFSSLLGPGGNATAKYVKDAIIPGAYIAGGVVTTYATGKLAVNALKAGGPRSAALGNTLGKAGSVLGKGLAKGGVAGLAVAGTRVVAGVEDDGGVADSLMDVGEFALMGATVGSMVAPGLGTAIGAGVGTAIGVGNELYEWASGDDEVAV